MKYLLLTSPTGGWFPSLYTHRTHAVNQLKLQLEKTIKEFKDTRIGDEAQAFLEGLNKENTMEQESVHRAGIYQWPEAFNRDGDLAQVKHMLNIAPADLEDYDIIHVNLCVPTGTKILGNPSLVAIEHVEAGDSTLEATGKVNRVLETFKRPYEGNLICLKVRGLPPQFFTPEHEIWVQGQGWRRALEIKVGDQVEVPRLKTQHLKTIDLSPYNRGVAGRGKGRGVKRLPNRIPLKIPFTEDLASFFGWWVAEGSVGGYKNSDVVLHLGKHERQKAEDLASTIKCLFNLKARIYEVETALRVVCASPLLSRFLASEFNHKATEKKLPNWLLHASKKLVKSFLKAYFDGDGNISLDKRWKYACFRTASETLAYHTYLLLLKLGYPATITLSIRKNHTIQGRVVNTKSIYSVRTYHAPFLGVTKRKPPHNGEHHFTEDAFCPEVRKTSIVPYKGSVYNIRTTNNEYLLPFRVHNCGADVDLVPKVKEALRASNVTVIANLDYAVEAHQASFPSPGALYKAFAMADFVFATEPAQQAYINYVLHYVLEQPRKKVYVPVIPHPVDVMQLHSAFVPHEERMDKVIVCYHRYDRHIYIPSVISWNLLAKRMVEDPETGKLTPQDIKVPRYMAGVSGEMSVPLDLFDGWINYNPWEFYLYELAHSTIGFSYWSIHSHDRFTEECVDPYSRVRTYDGMKPISKVQVGDRVLTGTGYFRKVVSVIRRSMNGKVVWFKAYGLAFQPMLTPEHPVLIANVKHKHSGPLYKGLDIKFLWKQAGEVSKGDFLVYPVRTESKDMPTVKMSYIKAYPPNDARWTKKVSKEVPLEEPLTRIVGFYLAEGSVANTENKKDGYYNITEFSFGLKEAQFVQQIIADALKLGFKGRVKRCPTSLKAILSSRFIAHFLADNFGHSASTKRIPRWYLDLPESKIKQTLNAYLMGDGSRVNDHRFTATTVSSELATDLRDLGFKLGYTVSQRLRKSRLMKIRGRTVACKDAYQLSFNSGRQERILLRDGNALMRVTSISRGEYKGDVYNLHVATDETFTTEGFVVHNCACLEIPCVGNTYSYSMQTLNPYTCHGPMDFSGMRASLLRLIQDDDFYIKCTSYAYEHVKLNDHRNSKTKLLFEMNKWLQAEGKAR